MSVQVFGATDAQYADMEAIIWRVSELQHAQQNELREAFMKFFRTRSGPRPMTTELGGALGIAVLGSVVTMIYRSTIVGALDNLTPGSLEAARGTLGDALSVAAALPDPLGAYLVNVSRRAFIEAFQAAALLSIFIAVIEAAATVLLLGRSQHPAAPSTSNVAES
jgi:hypothetical protein